MTAHRIIEMLCRHAHEPVSPDGFTQVITFLHYQGPNILAHLDQLDIGTEIAMWHDPLFSALYEQMHLETEDAPPHLLSAAVRKEKLDCVRGGGLLDRVRKWFLDFKKAQEEAQKERLRVWEEGFNRLPAVHRVPGWHPW
jgi:hypothetical protein